MPDNTQECKRRLKEIALSNINEETKAHPDYIKITKAIDRILDHNIVCADSLLFDYESWQPLSKKA